MSLVSRTHFEVLGLEASSPQKMPVLGSRTTVFFDLLKFCSSPEKKFEDVFFGDRLNLGCKTDSICVKTNQNLG